MPSATGGINTQQVSKLSSLLLRRENYINPEAASTTKVCASVDPSSQATVGTALTLQTAVDGKLLRRARRITLSVTDNAVVASSELSVTVSIVGYRQGILQTESLTATAVSSGVEKTETSTALFDEIISVTPIRIANAAASDALKVGIGGASFGLDRRIDSVNAVCSIINVANGTEAAPTAISSTTVDVANYCIQGITLAATDNWEIQYTGDGVDGIGRGHGART